MTLFIHNLFPTFACSCIWSCWDEVLVLKWTKMECSFQVRVSLCLEWWNPKYLRVSFLSSAKMELDQHVGASSAVIRMLLQSIDLKKKLSWKMYWSIYGCLSVGAAAHVQPKEAVQVCCIKHLSNEMRLTYVAWLCFLRCDCTHFWHAKNKVSVLPKLFWLK